MSEPKPKFVSIDIGASARAEIKTEIPSATSGRLIDALTDIIRPFTERRGLRADQIRLQREEVLIEIARRARHRIALEGASIQPVPNKFLIPFLERASLEDMESGLVESWSSLLVSASLYPNPNLVYYVSILSQLSADHCCLLEGILDGSVNLRELDKCAELEYEYVRYSSDVLEDIGSHEEIDAVCDAAQSHFGVMGISFVHMAAEKLTDPKDYYDIILDSEYSDQIEPIYAVLVNFGIVKLITYGFKSYKHWAITASFYVVTAFGLEFYKACKGLGPGPLRAAPDGEV